MSVTSDDTPKKQSKTKKVDRNDPSRFLEPGLTYRGKLIGIEDVPEPRGDKMCQIAMAKLKAAVKTIGDHKQKIVVNVSIDGIRIFDEKTESLVHFHPVHRISFISRDANDSRAFGYVYGQGAGSHLFFGIKTEKVAEGIVVCLRDLFQLVFEMKQHGNELCKKSMGSEEQGSADHHQQPFSSPKPISNRKPWLKSDHWCQSFSLPLSSHVSLEVFQGGNRTPGNTKKEIGGISHAQHSSVLSTYPANVLTKQSDLNLTGPLSRTAAVTEPIYQNASVFSGRLNAQVQSTATNSSSPSMGAATAPYNLPTKLSGMKIHPRGEAQGWVSFDNAERSSFAIAFDDRQTMAKKDPFANDPFFSKTPGSEESGEIAIWSHDKTYEKAEPIYGCFIEPQDVQGFADFSRFETHIDSNDSAWIPGKTGATQECQGLESLNRHAQVTLGTLTPETPTDPESLSDVVSFPSPDAPPPPLPLDIPMFFNQPAPVPPPRPGSSCSRKDSTTILNQSDHNTTISQVDARSNNVKPMPLHQQMLVSSNKLLKDASAELIIPPSLPLQSHTASHTSVPQEVNENDLSTLRSEQGSTRTEQRCIVQSPFTTAALLSKNITQPSVEAMTLPATSGQTRLKIGGSSVVSKITNLQSFDTSSSGMGDCSDIQKGTMDTSLSQSGICQNESDAVLDPFACLDPFTAKDFRSDPFASISDGNSLDSITSDLFSKPFSIESQSFHTQAVTSDTFSDTFDDVFSSRDDSDEKTENDAGPPDGNVVSHGLIKNAEKGNDIRRYISNKEDCISSDSSLSTITGMELNINALCSSVRSKDTPTSNGGIPDGNSRLMDNMVASSGMSEIKQQSSFDSVMEDFAQRFPPFDDCWMTLSQGDSSGMLTQSHEIHPTGSLQPDVMKTRLSIPKSSDSSTNSEIAEAFCDDGRFSSSRNVKPQTNT